MESPPKTQQTKPPMFALKSKCNPEACVPSAASPDKARKAQTQRLGASSSAWGWQQGPRPAGAAAAPSPLYRPRLPHCLRSCTGPGTHHHPHPHPPEQQRQRGGPAEPPPAPSLGQPRRAQRSPSAAGRRAGADPTRTQPGLGLSLSQGSGMLGPLQRGKSSPVLRGHSQHRILL